MRPEEIVSWTMTRGGRRLRQAVVDPLSHETWRRIIRDTYPTSLGKVGRVWVERFGQGIDWTATGLYGEAMREDWARRTVAAAGKDWATHLAKFSGAVLPREPIRVQPDPEVVAHAHRLLERARRAGTVAVGPADRDEVYGAQVGEKARRRARLGRGVCSGWADEEDYGPRYT